MEKLYSVSESLGTKKSRFTIARILKTVDDLRKEHEEKLKQTYLRPVTIEREGQKLKAGVFSEPMNEAHEGNGYVIGVKVTPADDGIQEISYTRVFPTLVLQNAVKTLLKKPGWFSETYEEIRQIDKWEISWKEETKSYLAASVDYKPIEGNETTIHGAKEAFEGSN